MVHQWLASSLLIGRPSKPFCWLIRLMDKQWSGLSTMKLASVLYVWSKYSLRSKFEWLKIPVFISIYLTQICYQFRLLLKYRVGQYWKIDLRSIVSCVMLLKYCTSVFLRDIAPLWYIPTHCLAQELTMKFWSPALQSGTISNSQHTSKPYIASP